MDLVTVMQRFPDQEACIKHLEKIGWGDEPNCPHCESVNIVGKNEEGEGRIGRRFCNDCGASFRVTCGTVFHKSKILLQKWFLAISLILNAKKSLSSYQLARDLELNQKTAWYIQTRIRAEMAKKSSGILPKGIIEADETYIGGKPRKRNKKEDRERVKRGRGTNKDAVIGVIERGGKVIAELSDSLSGRRILSFIRRHVNMKESELMTDEFAAYLTVGREMKHHIIDHKKEYVDGDVHTNTIEGFWSLLKRAWYGSHHHYTTEYTPLYVAEACYKYNYREHDALFMKFVNETVKMI